ncbi:hypothetical protein [Aeromonas salmonicida]|uniref:hypothetical protein n=1 Tax=Aeromonas salmonicida TaxID=645 RepID=UPI0005566C56|nr:hypothetical protein [Aeromonas salmonicida]
MELRLILGDQLNAALFLNQNREAFPQAAYATQLTSCLTGIPSTVILFIAFTPASASPHHQLASIQQVFDQPWLSHFLG